MMQKEEKVVGVILLMTLLTLIIAYLGFSTPVPYYSEDIKLGRHVYVEGKVIEKYLTKGNHLILRLSNLDIKVFIPENNGAKEVYDAVKIGDRVRITGRVSEYKNKREIVVESKDDVILLN